MGNINGAKNQIKADSLLKDLNVAQQKAVAWQGGPLLILAGAGSGKTRTLAHRAAWLVASGKAQPSQLLLLTFTNKAAEEMRGRLLNLLGQETGVKGLFAGTFHSFCAYILRRDGEKAGINRDFIIYDDADQVKLIKKAIGKLGLSDKTFKPRPVKSIVNSAKNSLIDPEEFLASSSGQFYRQVAHVYDLYQKQLTEARALDFNDLLLKSVKLFQTNDEVLAKYQSRYPYLLIDEYQDTNEAQYRLTKLLAAKHKNLTVVGDASQAIYSWRGANYRNIISLKSDFSDLKTINMERNYRSSQNILDTAFAVISKNKTHPILQLFTKNSQGDKVSVYQAFSESDEAGFVADEIKRLVNFKNLDPTKIAVLYRTNAQSRALEEVFLRRGISYVLIGGTKFYERAEVKDVLSLVRVAYNANDQLGWERIEKNFGKRRKAKIRQFLDDHKLTGWPPLKILENIIKASGYLDKYDSDSEDDTRCLENIEELKSVASQFTDLSSFLENVALVQQEYSLQEKEKRKFLNRSVRLMTIHASKGLEFGAVFLVGLEEGLLPHSQNIDETEKLEEERRLCYVGITRAQRYLYLTFCSQRLYFGRVNRNPPSRFLLDIPKNLLSGNFSRPNDDWENLDDDDWLDDVI